MNAINLTQDSLVIGEDKRRDDVRAGLAGASEGWRFPRVDGSSRHDVELLRVIEPTVEPDPSIF